MLSFFNHKYEILNEFISKSCNITLTNSQRDKTKKHPIESQLNPIKQIMKNARMNNHSFSEKS